MRDDQHLRPADHTSRRWTSEAVDGVPGLYRWSVIAKPNVSARVELTPTGWTPSKSVELKVDTRGRYTVKVEYQLGGRYSSLTTRWPTSRFWCRRRRNSSGGWCEPATIAEYSDARIFPYYEDRLAELPRGAEMLIEPDPDPQSGGGPSTIGTRFIGSFVIPPVLEFEDGRDCARLLSTLFLQVFPARITTISRFPT
jgi:hypothetical protein